MRADDNDCFPVMIPGTPNDKPYLKIETEGYLVHLWYENLGVAELRFNMSYYRQIHETKKLHEGIRQSQKLIKEAEKEFEEMTQGKHTRSRKEESSDDTNSEDTDEIQCYWGADGLHQRTDPVDLKRLNKITITEDITQGRIFDPIDLREGFNQAEINNEDAQPRQKWNEDLHKEMEEYLEHQLNDKEFEPSEALKAQWDIFVTAIFL
ncbi:hypothetical protein IL306_001174 [Fusarium sp. DS 682]|nr:hypothetical protein IL306_001174 [Fusarium sp. DS 682]